MKKQIKTQIKQCLEKALNCRIIRHPPHGLDPFVDMKKRIPENSFKVVFDVGANDGRSAVQFLPEFSAATIYCFEPVRSTFEELESSMGSNKRVKSFNLALGSSEGEAVVEKNENSRCNQLSLEIAPENSGETVTVSTLDIFCEQHNIPQIDFLKIDTEGFDLEVLKGAEKYINDHKISFLQIEASMNPHNVKHVAFETFKSFLESRGYLLYGVYDQTLERFGEPVLRYSNPIFISEKLTQASRFKQR